MRSVGQVDDVETLTGEMMRRQLELDLTIDGQARPT